MIVQNNGYHDGVAALSVLANGAEAPSPLPLHERVRSACEDKRGEYGGDLLLLGARLDAFLGRPATVEEIDVYADAAAAICGDRDGLDGLFGGLQMLVTDGSRHDFVNVGTPLADRYRDELLASGTGCVDFGASRSWMPPDVIEHVLAADENRKATVRFQRVEDALSIYADVSSGQNVEGHGRNEESAVDALRTAADLGFFAGVEWAREARNADPDLAAIEALQPGQTWTKILADAQVLSGRPFGSLRTCVERPFDGRGLRVYLEEYGPDADDRYNAWNRVEPLRVGDEAPLVGVGFDDAVNLADALAVHRVYALHVSAAMKDEARLAWESAEDEKQALPGVAPILALKEGETYTEERWGPYLLAGGEVRDGRYLTEELRLVVEADQGPDGKRRFSLHIERRNYADAWEADDLGFGTSGRVHEAFGMTADIDNVETCLAAFLAILDNEGREMETEEDAISERERYGITDEHLRTGTLSEITKAELAAEKVAA